MSSNKLGQQLENHFSSGSQGISVIPAKVRKSPSAVPQCRMSFANLFGVTSSTTGGLQTETDGRQTEKAD